jgi:O-antigen/teichoic acid export membrane protein
LIKDIKKAFSHRGLQRYSVNTIWLLFEKSLRIFSAFFVGVWVARYLGPEQFGALNYIVSFVALFAAFSSLGLDVILVRELVKNEKNSAVLLGTTFILKFAGAILAISLIFISSYFTSNDQNINVMILIVATTIIFSSFNVIDLYFQAKVKSKYVVYANIVVLTCSSIIKILLILSNASLYAFIWVLLFDSVFYAIGYVYVYFHNKLSIKEWKFESKVALSLFKDCWPLLLSGVAIAIYMRVDQIMIKEMLDLNAVGQYAAAVRISEAWYFIPMILGASLSPAIINAKKNSEILYYTRLQNFYTMMVWAAILIAIPIAFFSQEIIDLLYGVDFSGAAQVLVIHVWAGIFLALGVACGKWYLAENYTLGALYKALLGMTVNIVGNYILIPIYGINGAALSTLAAHFSANILYDIIDPRVRGQLKYKMRAFLPYYLFREVGSTK